MFSLDHFKTSKYFIQGDDWREMVKKLSDEIETKLGRDELDQIKKELEKRQYRFILQLSHNFFFQNNVFCFYLMKFLNIDI